MLVKPTDTVTAYLAPVADLAAADSPERLQALVDFLGYRPTALLTMARKPRLLPAILELVQVVLRGPGLLDEALRFLVATEASRCAGCGYSAAHTAHAAEQLGVSLVKLAALDRYETSTHYSARERAALALATVAAQPMSKDAHRQRDTAFATAGLHFGEEEVIELVAVISAFGWFNRWNSLVRSELEAEPATVVSPLPWLANLVNPDHDR